ncbi:MAG: HD domain-containing protein [Spirochaetales bacterium]|nr:HD domain-containing protein [Spirochaetales bacterium]
MNMKLLLNDPRWESLIKLSLPYQDSRRDSGHAETVTSWAVVLMEEYKAISEDASVDKEVLLIAAFLHDIGWSQISEEARLRLFDSDLSASEEDTLRLAHEKQGVELAGKLMGMVGYSKKLIDSVCTLILGHDTREGFLSVEDGILQDADKLWMVTDAGFSADLMRRGLSSSVWAGILRTRFLKDDIFYLPVSRKRALRRLLRLGQGRSVLPPGGDESPRVLICHYRVGWTDGVSLEIEKRQAVLEEMGFRVALLGGPGSTGADYVIPALDFDTDEARNISRSAFGGESDFENEEELSEAVLNLSDRVEAGVRAAFSDWDPDFILLHNIFSHGRHIAAARAFTRALEDFNRPALTTHHDFYWERDDFKNPANQWVEGFLAKYVPPVIPGMRHAVINSLAARNLLSRTGIDAMIFPDTLDFSVEPWVQDDYNNQLLKDFDLSSDDIFILQATRIVRRKGIELIPPIISKLNTPEYLRQLIGKRLYNGKFVTEKSKFVFLLAGYAELEAETYRQDFIREMESLGVPYRFLRTRIAAERATQEEGKIYSLFDTYPHADLVSYPSIYEGWGNQFIEAVFARCPVIVYEYPVYKSDIKPKGYQVVSLGDSALLGEKNLYTLSEDIITRVCDEVIGWLLSEETPCRLEENFELAKSNNSYDYLRELMRRSMAHCEGCENL